MESCFHIIVIGPHWYQMNTILLFMPLDDKVEVLLAENGIAKKP
jgi:hypothetical protein